MAASIHYRIISVFLIFCYCFESAQPDCIVEENKTVSMSCTVDVGNSCPTGGTIFSWVIGKENDWIPIVNCAETICLGGLNYAATVIGSGSAYTSNLTITGVERSSQTNLENEWRCQPAAGCTGSDETACPKLNIYALPESPTCSVTEIFDQNGTLTSIHLNLSTSKVYPAADCEFYVNSSPTHVNGTQVEAYGDPVYYSYQCVTNYSLTDLGEGNHTFESLMYPRFDGGESVSGLVNTTCESISLSLPTCRIDCDPQQRDGYLRGDSATCNCVLATEGYPRGTTEWVDVDTLNNDGSITFDRSSESTQHVCRGTSPLGEGPECDVSTKFAYLDANSTHVEVISFSNVTCDRTINNEITVLCKVPKGNANPGVDITLSFDGRTFTAAADENGDFYQKEYNFPIDKGGTFEVVCETVNSIFPEIKDMARSQSFTVYGPPSDAPIITVGETIYRENNLNASIPDGFQNDITCTVDGGYPSVDNISLQCTVNGSVLNSSSDGILSFQDYALKSDMDFVTCTCSAQHTLECYDLKTTVQLFITGSRYTMSTNLPSESGDSEVELALVIGLILGILVILLLGAVIYLVWKNRKLRMENSKGKPGNYSGVYLTPIDAPVRGMAAEPPSQNQQQPQTSHHYEPVIESDSGNQPAFQLSARDLYPENRNLSERPEAQPYDLATEQDTEAPDVYQPMRQPQSAINYVNVDGLMSQSNNEYNNVSNYVNVAPNN